ncbi:hypothetical protein DUNSADRAFT_10382, partial [Dunaliella salina]
RQKDALRQKTHPDPAAQHELARVTLQLAKWTAAQRQQSYNDLKKLFEDASRVDPNWDKVFFQYARYLDQLFVDAKQRQTGGGASGSGSSSGASNKPTD